MDCTYILQGFVLFILGQYICLSSGAETDSNATEINLCEITNIVELMKRMQDESEFQRAELPPDEADKIVYVEDIKYYLYTNSKKKPFVIENGDVAKLSSEDSNFDPKNLNVFIIHGWKNDYKSPVNKLIKNATLEKQDANVFVVDWSKHSYDGYLITDALRLRCQMNASVKVRPEDLFSKGAAGSSIKVAAFVGQFIAAMMKEFKVKGEQIMLIGHSLGAHISGIAGYTVHKIIGKYIKVIVGLDPPMINFFSCKPGDCLDKTDAENVQVIYTSGVSSRFETGHANFYPNGLEIQPACTGLGFIEGTKCDHSMSYQYYAESIRSDQFVAYRCDSIDHFDSGQCSENHRARLGGIEVDTSAEGSYYLRTNGKSPYAKGNRVLMKSRRSDSFSTGCILSSTLFGKLCIYYIINFI